MFDFWKYIQDLLNRKRPEEDTGNFVPVSSSNLDKLKYNPKEKTLEVVFKNGGKYRYPNVSKHVYDKLLNAESKGKYFHRAIKKQNKNFVKLSEQYFWKGFYDTYSKF